MTIKFDWQGQFLTLPCRIRPCGEICPLCCLHFARIWASSYLRKVVIILTMLQNGTLRHFKAIHKIKLEMHVQLQCNLAFQTEHKSLFFFFFSLTHTLTHTLIRASHAQIASWYSIKRMANLFHLPVTHLNQQAVTNHKLCKLSPLPRYHLVTSMIYFYLHMC
jgi:hypothetical protein